MNMESEEPVRILREKLAGEFAVLDNLSEKFTQQSMKDSVARARSSFEEVEIALNNLGKHSQIPGLEVQAISKVNMMFELAVPKRRQLQDSFNSYGPDAVLMPTGIDRLRCL
jgi:hypothetical protein